MKYNYINYKRVITVKKFDKQGNFTEAYSQAKLFEYIDKNILKDERYRLIFAIPNGGSRNIREALSLKLQGLRAGIPDIFVSYASKNYNGLYIEMKKKGGRVSPHQKSYLELFTKYKYLCVVCYSTDEAINTINDYFN